MEKIKRYFFIDSPKNGLLKKVNRMSIGKKIAHRVNKETGELFFKSTGRKLKKELGGKSGIKEFIKNKNITETTYLQAYEILKGWDDKIEL